MRGSWAKKSGEAEQSIWLMSWRDFRERALNTKLAFLPVGCIEPHGPHLPLGTDFLIAEFIATRLSERMNGLLLPVITYGVVRGLSGFPGAIRVPPVALEETVYGILSSLGENGINRVIIVNGHGSEYHVKAINKGMDRAWYDSRVRSALVNWWVYARKISDEVFGASGDHAGTAETAMVVAINDLLLKDRPIKDEDVEHLKSGIRAVPWAGSILLHEGEDMIIPNKEEAEAFVSRLLDRLE
ncbi:MAG TPA: creatininase family protein, partial [Candidatus Korarchaeota archaeon]|nr:creatininase family protein [Candidatus Korarchaeota archaeon]